MTHQQYIHTFSRRNRIKPKNITKVQAIRPPLTPSSLALQSSKISSIRLNNLRNIWRTWFLRNLHTFCETTSLHGLNYAVLSSISKKERIFWIIIFIISIIISISLVKISYTWNKETPTVTVIESSHYPSWNIPFPAITICSFNKISKMAAINLIKSLQRPDNISDTKLLELFRAVMHLSFFLDLNGSDYRLLKTILILNNYSLEQLTNTLTPNCLNMLEKCVWKGTTNRCFSLFQRINTLDGVCCSFNYFGVAGNNFPKKVAYKVPKRPYHVSGCGYQTALSLLLKIDTDDYYGSSFSSYGFRLYVHDNYDFPDENAGTKIISGMRETFIRINPEETYATDEVRRLKPIARNCLFSKERQLSVMQRYSFVNCMFECRLQIVYRRCGCIPINLARNGIYPVCEVNNLDCIAKMRGIFSKDLPHGKPTGFLNDSLQQISCDCLPDCERNTYASEITMGHLNHDFNNRKKVLGSALNSVDENTTLLMLHIFYTDLLSTRYRTQVYENWLTTLASFGGLLGLLMGFSIVTVFEFIYILIFSPFWRYVNRL